MLPLTFIAGVYEMNFENMPELHSRYGYYATWGIMLIVAFGMLLYFKRRGWIGRSSEDETPEV
jgi:magnesium transporter